MRTLLLALLVAPVVPHACMHDAYTRNITKVRAPPSDGAPTRRAEAANAAPIRIVALYRNSAGGTDISTETGMNTARKAVVEAAMTSALARFSSLLRVTPVSGNLFAYSPCTSRWSNGNCRAVDTAAPTCGTISLSSFLGAQTIFPSNANTPSTLSASGAGVPSADNAMFVTAQQTTTCGSDTLAYASYCQRASNDRPTFGYINFCPNKLPTSTTAPGYEDLLSTALHEITHVLAFSSSLFPYFRDDSGAARTPRDSFGYPADEYYQTVSCSGSSRLRSVASPSTISYANERGMDCSWGSATTWAAANIPYGSGGKAPGDCVARISTPRVAAAAKVFFGCSTLAGADLENQDTSDCFVQGSHWDARTMASEFMAAYSSKGSKISPITLAVFEDSGWYSPVYSSGDAWFAGKDWGYKQGCAFATEKCSASNAGSPPHFVFGSALGTAPSCTVDRRFQGFTSISAYSSALPIQYRYFSSTSWGGSAAHYDYCPAVQPYTSSDCTSTATLILSYWGELTGSSSLCHLTTLRASGYSSASAQDTGCYRVACAANRASYTVTLASGATATCSTDGAAATFSGFSGSLICGNPAFVCGTGDVWDGSATPSITPSATPTPTGTGTRSPTSSGTSTGTPSSTGTGTCTPSSTSTNSLSSTPSTTSSLSPTPSTTPSLSSTNTLTATPSSTLSLSSSSTATPSPSSTEICQTPSTSLLYSFGVDEAGGPFAPGARDPHYQYSCCGTTETFSPVTWSAAPVLAPAAEYAAGTWLGFASGSPSAYHAFRTTFGVFDVAVSSFSAQWACDDSCALYVNGVSVAVAASYTSIRTLSVSGGFRCGNNTLEVRVFNAGSGHSPNHVGALFRVLAASGIFFVPQRSATPTPTRNLFPTPSSTRKMSPSPTNSPWAASITTPKFFIDNVPANFTAGGVLSSNALLSLSTALSSALAPLCPLCGANVTRVSSGAGATLFALCGNPSSEPLFPTGVDAQGAPLANYQRDPHYDFACCGSSYDFSTAAASWAPAQVLHYPEWPTAAYGGRFYVGYEAEVPSNTYSSYRTSFGVFDLRAASLELRVWCDDTCALFINGREVGRALASYNVGNEHLVCGLNVLELRVYNYDAWCCKNPSGAQLAVVRASGVNGSVARARQLPQVSGATTSMWVTTSIIAPPSTPSTLFSSPDFFRAFAASLAVSGLSVCVGSAASTCVYPPGPPDPPGFPAGYLLIAIGAAALLSCAAICFSKRARGCLHERFCGRSTAVRVLTKDVDHCRHCRGLEGGCACPSKPPCARPASAACTPVVIPALPKDGGHCHHCRGLAGGCACPSRPPCARPAGAACTPVVIPALPKDGGHCHHCRGLAGGCACPSRPPCARPAGAACALSGHCTHCRGNSGDCACPLQPPCARPAGGACTPFFRGNHSGEWRRPEVQLRSPGALPITKYCASGLDSEGVCCTHLGLITDSHWSCCGGRDRYAPCAPFRFERGAHVGEWRQVTERGMRLPGWHPISNFCGSAGEEEKEGVPCRHDSILKADHWSCCGSSALLGSPCATAEAYAKLETFFRVSRVNAAEAEDMLRTFASADINSLREAEQALNASGVDFEMAVSMERLHALGPGSKDRPALLARVAPALSHPHPLTLVMDRPNEYPGGEAQCNACCRTELPVEYHCADCKFDLCLACFSLAACEGLAHAGSHFV